MMSEHRGAYPVGAPLYGPAPRSYGEPPLPVRSPGPARSADGTPLDQKPPDQTSQDRAWPPRASDYARWRRRVPAFLIDAAPVLLGCLVLMFAYAQTLVRIADPTSAGESSQSIIILAVAGGLLVLVGLGWSIRDRWRRGGQTGRSLGKRLLGLRLVSDRTGQPIGSRDAFVRDVLHILDCLSYVGFFWPLWDDKRQTFADMLMRCVVVDDRATKAPQLGTDQRAS
jgi:uncharacterized RDD family membrane protein YckC